MSVRPVVEWFASEMEKQLAANDFKGGWQEDDLMQLLLRLQEETNELFAELILLPITLKGDRDNISFVIKEAADVANFALMIADRVSKIGE